MSSYDDDEEEEYEGKTQNILQYKKTIVQTRKHSTSMIDWALGEAEARGVINMGTRQKTALDFLKKRYTTHADDAAKLWKSKAETRRLKNEMEMSGLDRMSRIAKLKMNVKFVEGKFKSLLEKKRQKKKAAEALGVTQEPSALSSLQAESPEPMYSKSRFQKPGDALAFFKSKCKTLVIVGVWLNMIKNMDNNASWERELQTFLNLMMASPGNKDMSAPFETEGGEVKFDRKDFSANKEISLSVDVKTILSIRPEGRTPRMIEKVALGLQTLKSLCEYPLDTQEQICKVAWYQQVPASKNIIKQGHKPESFYFIISGIAVVKKFDADTGKSSSVVASLTKGQSFGELGLIFKNPRSATVESATHMELLVVGKADFLQIFMQTPKHGEDESHITFLKQQPVMKHWPFEAIKDDPSLCLINYYKSGTLVVASAKKSDWVYFIKSGSCDAMKKLKAVTPRNEKQLKRQYYVKEVKNILPDPFGKYCHDLVVGKPTMLHNELYTSINSYYNTIRRQQEMARRAAALSQTKEDGNPVDPAVALKSIPNTPCVLPPIKPQNTDGPGVSSSRFDFYSHQNGHADFTIPTQAHITSTLKAKKVRRFNFMGIVKKVQAHPDVYVTVERMLPRDIFGMNTVWFPDHPAPEDLLIPDCALISRGAEIIMLSKKVFIKHANDRTKIAVMNMTTKYPPEEDLRASLQTRANWGTFREQVIDATLLSNKILKAQLKEHLTCLV